MEPLGMRRMGEHDIAAKDPLLMTEAEAYAYYAPDTAFVIDLSLAGTNTFTRSFATGSYGSPVTIDWGDGTTTDVTAAHYGTGDISHTYKDQGKYVIRIKDYGAPISVLSVYDHKPQIMKSVVRVLRFSDSGVCAQFAGARNLREFPDGKLPRWPANATDIWGVYRNCTSLAPTELPEWPKGLKTIGPVYANCKSLAATEIPKWPESVTILSEQWIAGWNTAYGVYEDCTSLAATALPEWPSSLTSANSTFQNCTSLAVTELPAWPSSLTRANYTFYNCQKLAATALPDWPSSLTSANSTFQNCQKLAATNVPDWSVCANLTSANSTFQNCTSLAATALPDWPTTLTQANYTFSECPKIVGPIPDWSKCEKLTQINRTFWHCYALTGDIPAWPPNVVSAERTFTYDSKVTGTLQKWPSTLTQVEACLTGTGLTGAWTDDPAELMPTNITSHGICVMDASDALRALFYSDWGGTRTKEETTTT